MGTSGPFTGNLFAWFDAAATNTLFQDNAGATPVTADAQSVGKWNDRSGNGNHVTQATGGAKPTYKVAIQSGKPALLYDTGDYLDSVATLANFPTTIVGVAKNGSTTGTQRGLVSAYHSILGGLRVYMDAANTLTGSVGLVEVTKANTNKTIAAGTPVLFGVQADSGNVYTVSDGTVVAAVSLALTTSQIVRVGGTNDNNTSNLLDGYLCEVLIYTALLNAAELATTVAYLDQKWAVY